MKTELIEELEGAAKYNWVSAIGPLGDLLPRLLAAIKEGELSEMQAIALAETATAHRRHGEHTGVVPKGRLHPYQLAALLITILTPYRNGILRYRKSDPDEANRAVMDTEAIA